MSEDDTLPGILPLTQAQLDALGKRLAIEEGDRLVAYYDTAVPPILTVGRGHNCKIKPVPGVTKPGDRITQEQDDELFASDVAEACQELDSKIPWWRDLDAGRQCVMVDLCFNMGINTLISFQHTLGFVRQGLWDLAATGMSHSLWASQVGSRAMFLEGAMRTGIYS